MADGEESAIGDKDAVLQNQKREKRELQARIQEMKNAVPKGDKKRRKELNAEVTRLEQELDKRHSEERLKLQNDRESPVNTQVDDLSEDLTNDLHLTLDDSIPEAKGRMSKAQKRREKKAAAAVERETRIAEQEVENLHGVRHLEEVSINTLLHKKGLQLYQIPADGNCLYQAVIHQLGLRNETKPECRNISDLRSATASQLRKDVENYLPFLTSSQTGEPMTAEEFETYCVDLESTNVWGGQIELRAISEALHTPIEVIQASGPSISLGEEFISDNKPLILSYHRHAYGLGEHYNSVEPKTSKEDSADNFVSS